MLPCAPDTVYTALSWIHSIRCGPGRGLLAALSLALSDPTCHAVHLLATDLPDQLEAVLSALPVLAAKRPVNTFYLQESYAQLDGDTRHYLQCLTQATGGSCYVIIDGSDGKLGKVIPLFVAESQSSVPFVSPVRCRCPSTSVMIPQQQHNMSSLLRSSLDYPARLVPSCVLSDRTLARSEFFPGSCVLARREVDGLYYLGTVIQQVQGRTGVWVVEFDCPGTAGLGVVSSQRQLVCSLDMVSHHLGHHTRCLVPGDAVLSPWGPNLRRYGPGRVMAAPERRANGVVSLRVLMWNGCVSLVPDRLVLPILESHHDRITRELQIPTSAQSQNCSWLCAYSVSCPPEVFCFDCSTSPCCPSVTNHQPSVVPTRYRSSLGDMDGFERAMQDKRLDLKDTEMTKSDPESCSSSSLTDVETRASFPPAVKMRSKHQRPPWRYWRSIGPEPQHRQPGSEVPRRTSKPVKFSTSLSNHSSMFQSLPGACGRRANIIDIFGMNL
ncbi:uncharacterized protein C11orf16 homolog isoform X1 [Platichthys flesus]|uniref:uncharacterized protein C11orf16 homolog isoform X1 n=1 Tax=Platichthys flesus TaxID=8260 RepID=UPI002DBB5F53|nr:uncharacterized protein C11orf16 homolog isoform X1 [Platichthys flesus]